MADDFDMDAFEFVFRERAFAPPEDVAPRGWQNECESEYIRRLRAHAAAAPRSQFRFLLSAGVGSGKTIAAAKIACYLLNRGLAQRLVYVAPNRAIKRAVRATFRRFGVNLVDWSNQRHGRPEGLGEPAMAEGCVLTYQALASRPDIQRTLCRKPTLVVFDEIHHLGDRLEWGGAAERAFGAAAFVLGLSGTPYRTDNRAIPFVAYEPGEAEGLRKFRADYSYSLGRAINEGVCRKPYFDWIESEVIITGPSGSARSYRMSDADVSEETANLRLAGAVRSGTRSRLEALRKAIEACRAERRKLIIFVGGDTSNPDATAIEDATRFLPREIESLGVDPAHIVPVTSGHADALHKIEAFGKGDAWILLTVNMVSEGVDIPELSAALFLTSITAKSTTVQRIGRVLRGHGSALIFMFKDRRYVDFGLEIEREVTHEFLARSALPDPAAGGGGDPPHRSAREAIGVDAWIDGATTGSAYFTEDEKRAAARYLEAKGWPRSREYLQIVLIQMRAGELNPGDDRREAI
jgi:superfamily II DNA or RNA helicase